ncbi:MAG: cellulase family glycosylhydrolase [Clostridia bacterium]|nr:cellulase family glycosylhydrolase [Clostridia bacterium]
MRFITGVNYWPAAHGVQMWPEFDAAEITRDMHAIRSMGMGAVRVFLRWADFQPASDRVEMVVVERFDQVLTAARDAGVGLIPTFFCGHMSGENWDAPWRAGRDPYSDPGMLRAQTSLVGLFAERYRDEETIICWDLANEQDIFVRPRDHHSGWRWVHILASEIRKHDRSHPITAGIHISSLWEDCGFRPEDLAESLDFLCMHAYPSYSEACPERLDGVRSTYFVPFCAALTRALGGGADVLLEEFGATSQMNADDVIERYYCTTLHSLLAEGAMGAMGWCYSDFRVGERRPYDTTPYEVGFGIVDCQRRPKGAGRAMARFNRTIHEYGCDARCISGQPYKPRVRRCAIAVPRRYYDNYDADITPSRNFTALFNSYVLARRAGLDPDMITLDADLAPYRLLFLPSVSRRGSVNNSDWNRLTRYVDAGGALYMSYDGVALEGMGELFGMEVRYAVNEGPGARVEMARCGGSSGSGSGNGSGGGDGSRSGSGDGGCCGALAVASFTGRRMVVCPTAGSGLWKGSDDASRVVAAKHGAGATVFCDFPLELSVAHVSGVYEFAAFQEVYRAAARHAGYLEPASTDCSDVSATILDGGGEGERTGRILVLVNYAPNPLQARLTCPEARALADRESGEEMLPGPDGLFHMDMDANGGRVMEIVYANAIVDH